MKDEQKPLGGEQEQLKAEKLEIEPRIYVASLSDYNDGRLHGIWINAAQDSQDIWTEVQRMLSTAPLPGAEEYAIHDYENFGPLQINEYEDLETVAYIAKGIAEHGIAFAHWATLFEPNDPESFGHFEDVYHGHFKSLIDYANELFDDLGYSDLIEKTLPEYLQPYVRLDVDGFAKDLELSGDIVTSEGDDGVYIFDAMH